MGWTRALRCPLTTIRQPHRDKGRLAGKLIRDLVYERAADEANLLPAELIVRASARPARTER
jgi:DNA-binding LacI/PurR family transcriptional regulator